VNSLDNFHHGLDDYLDKFLARASTKQRAAWETFVGDGRFRLARPEEFNIPEAKKRPYLYATLVDLKFGRTHEYLAAIVVDTTRRDAKRFGLVIFGARKRQDPLRPYWLYRGQDLSRASLSKASTEIYVTQYLGHENETACSIKWNRIRRRFYCE
jgi:hypothetical protein